MVAMTSAVALELVMAGELTVLMAGLGVVTSVVKTTSFLEVVASLFAEVRTGIPEIDSELTMGLVLVVLVGMVVATVLVAEVEVAWLDELLLSEQAATRPADALQLLPPLLQ